MDTPTKTPAGIVVAHADHGLGAEHLAFIDEVLAEWDGSFRVFVVDLPDNCSDLTSALYGPAAGDDPIGEDQVTYERRGNRPGPSRLIDAPHRPVRRMILIAGPGRDEPMIYTAYGGQSASPREWWDSGMKPREAIEAAQFWSEHALAK